MIPEHRGLHRSPVGRVYLPAQLLGFGLLPECVSDHHYLMPSG
jgi:hypothetical protein